MSVINCIQLKQHPLLVVIHNLGQLNFEKLVLGHLKVFDWHLLVF